MFAVILQVTGSHHLGAAVCVDTQCRVWINFTVPIWNSTMAFCATNGTNSNVCRKNRPSKQSCLSGVSAENRSHYINSSAHRLTRFSVAVTRHRSTGHQTHKQKRRARIATSSELPPQRTNTGISFRAFDKQGDSDLSKRQIHFLRSTHWDVTAPVRFFMPPEQSKVCITKSPTCSGKCQRLLCSTRP